MDNPAEIIRQAMAAHGLTAENLAQQMKLPVHLIHKMLDGHPIPPALAILFAEHLNVPYKKLVYTEQAELGLRHNQGKLRYDLVSPFALEELARVYTKGAEKYPERNWEKGLPLMDCFASLMRHAWTWAKGEDLDPETGIHHMAHAMWNAAAIVHFHCTKQTMLDNRKSQKIM